MTGPSGEGADAAAHHGDSAGQEPRVSPFAEDDGRAAPQLLAALADGDPVRLMAALAEARLLSPVVAYPDDEPGHAHMATVSIVAPDGRRAMVAFSGLQALGEWDPGARPVPVSSADLAAQALAEGVDAVLLDRGGSHQAVLTGSMLRALADRRDWVPAHQDAVVGAAVAAVAQGEPSVIRADLTGGGPGVTVLQLAVTPGLGDQDLTGLLTRIGQRLADDPELVQRLDEVQLRVVPGTG